MTNLEIVNESQINADKIPKHVSLEWNHVKTWNKKNAQSNKI